MKIKNVNKRKSEYFNKIKNGQIKQHDKKRHKNTSTQTNITYGGIMKGKI